MRSCISRPSKCDVFMSRISTLSILTQVFSMKCCVACTTYRLYLCVYGKEDKCVDLLLKPFLKLHNAQCTQQQAQESLLNSVCSLLSFVISITIIYIYKLYICLHTQVYIM